MLELQLLRQRPLKLDKLLSKKIQGQNWFGDREFTKEIWNLKGGFMFSLFINTSHVLLEAELCTSVGPKDKIRVGGSRTVQLQFLGLPGTNSLEQKIINAEVSQLGREEGATLWTRKIWGRSWGCQGR